jgi:hypothetical protein
MARSLFSSRIDFETLIIRYRQQLTCAIASGSVSRTLGSGGRQQRRDFRRKVSFKACDLRRTHVSLLERDRIDIMVSTARQIAPRPGISLAELFRGLACKAR